MFLKLEHIPIMKPVKRNGHPISCFGQALTKTLIPSAMISNVNARLLYYLQQPESMGGELGVLALRRAAKLMKEQIIITIIKREGL
jgi:hypothetical protein